jgi:hypothetical protein
MLLQPDADGMTGRPQVAAVICRFRIFRSTSHWEHVLRQEPRDRLDLDCMHQHRQGMEYRETAAMLATAHSAATCSWASALCTWEWSRGLEETWTVYCSIYAAAWTDLRSLHWHRQSSTINRQRNAAGRQQISHKVIAMSAVPVVLHSLHGAY